MGLSAVVYRSKKHLGLIDEHGVYAEPDTGEVLLPNEELSSKFKDQRYSEDQHFGNIAEIGELREEAIELIGIEAVLVKTVLYSGSHSGDTVGSELFSALSTEIASLRSSPRTSAQMKELLNSLDKLIQAARREDNPIVFV